MALRTALTERLAVRWPIVQAPLAGGGDTPALVAAVGEAGGIGFIGAAYSAPTQIAAAAAAVRQRSRRPFGINLFAPGPPPPSVPWQRAAGRLAPYFAELGLSPPAEPPAPDYTFEQQLEAALASGASAFSFTFGLLPEPCMRALAGRGMLVLGTATTVEEARALERSGVDALIAQGAEAGGHRGTFLGDAAEGLVGTLALVPQVVDAVRVPVVAAGGIMDGRGIAACLTLGAAGVQMGTAFLACEESGIPTAYRRALLAGREDRTGITRAFSGRAARGIVNRFMREMHQGDPADVLPFPLQNRLTQPLRRAAAAQDRAEFLSLWAGQGLRLVRGGPAGALLERLAEECAAALRGPSGLLDRGKRRVRRYGGPEPVTRGEERT